MSRPSYAAAAEIATSLGDADHNPDEVTAALVHDGKEKRCVTSCRLDIEIARAPFFSGMSKNHMSVLAGCAAKTRFEKGQLIFHQGETANRFYLVETGCVELKVAPGLGGPSLGTIGSGRLLGWSWLFEPYEWQFTARALTETSAIFFYGTILREYCEEDPSLGFELFKRMSKVMIKRLQSARSRLSGAKSGFSPVGEEHELASEAWS